MLHLHINKLKHFLYPLLIIFTCKHWGSDIGGTKRFDTKDDHVAGQGHTCVGQKLTSKLAWMFTFIYFVNKALVTPGHRFRSLIITDRRPKIRLG